MRKVSDIASVGCVRRVCLRRNAPFLVAWWQFTREEGALRYR